MNKFPEKYNDKNLEFIWTYRRPDHEIIGYVVRYENKDGDKDVIPFFKWKNDQWLPGIELNPTPLYGLDRLVKYSEEDVVIIVEGEKCALALRRLGYCAATSIGGANAAKKADWSVLERYKQIVIMPDNNEPGVRYARDVYLQLKQINPDIDVKILELPNLPEGGDIVDYIQRYLPNWDGYSRIEDDTDQLSKRIAKLLKKAGSVPDEWSEGLGQNFDWKEPLPIDSILLPVLPLRMKMVPEPLTDWLWDIGLRMQTPRDIVAVTAVVVFGALIGSSCGVRPKQLDNWEVVPNLWGACVARPSIMLKTPSMNQVIRLVERLQAKYCELHKELQVTEKLEMAEIEAKIEEIESQIHELSKQDDSLDEDVELLKTELIELNQKLENKSELRLFVTNETSVQSLVKLHETNPRGNLVHKDELHGLLAAWLCKDGQSERAFYLSGWNGNESYTDFKIGRGLTRAECICISLLGGIQPDKLKVYLDEISKGKNDGMLQRFQLMVYPDPVEWQFVDKMPNKEAEERVFKIMERIASMDFTEFGATMEDSDKRPYFRFSLEAQKIATNWLINLQTVKIMQEQNPVVQEHLGKYRSLMPSLALIFHLITVADLRKSRSKISKHSVRQAIDWCNYLESHTRRIYAMVTPVEISATQHLASKIKGGKIDNPFSAKDIYDKKWSGLTKPKEVEAACQVLIEKNWLILGETPKSNGGRPPAPKYYINPAIF